MEEMLRHERVKMQALLTEERASSARRVGALQKELDVAKRQLEVERNRTAKVRTSHFYHLQSVEAVGALRHDCQPRKMKTCAPYVRRICIGEVEIRTMTAYEQWREGKDLGKYR